MKYFNGKDFVKVTNETAFIQRSGSRHHAMIDAGIKYGLVDIIGITPGKLKDVKSQLDTQGIKYEILW